MIPARPTLDVCPPSSPLSQPPRPQSPHPTLSLCRTSHKSDIVTQSASSHVRHADVRMPEVWVDGVSTSWRVRSADNERGSRAARVHVVFHHARRLSLCHRSGPPSSSSSCSAVAEIRKTASELAKGPHRRQKNKSVQVEESRECSALATVGAHHGKGRPRPQRSQRVRKIACVTLALIRGEKRNITRPIPRKHDTR